MTVRVLRVLLAEECASESVCEGASESDYYWERVRGNARESVVVTGRGRESAWECVRERA